MKKRKKKDGLRRESVYRVEFAYERQLFKSGSEPWTTYGNTEHIYAKSPRKAVDIAIDMLDTWFNTTDISAYEIFIFNVKELDKDNPKIVHKIERFDLTTEHIDVTFMENDKLYYMQAKTDGINFYTELSKEKIKNKNEAFDMCEDKLKEFADIWNIRFGRFYLPAEYFKQKD